MSGGKKTKKKRRTRLGIIVTLYKDGFIDDWVLWNLLGSRFKKSELEEIDKTFRKYYKKQNDGLEGNN